MARIPWDTMRPPPVAEKPRRDTPLDYALAYAGMGWRVFPVVHGQKVPMRGTNGVSDATCNLDQVRAWWTANPNANIGIAMGQGIVAIDVDVADGKQGAESWDALVYQHALAPTVQSITGSGGWHFLFRAPPGVRIPNSTSKLGPGLDVRGDGGYIVAEPSIHPNGRNYTWESEGDPLEGAQLADAPQSLLDLLASAPRTERAPTNGAQHGKLPQGGRNDALARFAGVARGAGLDMPATRALVHTINDQFCAEPLPSNELESTVLKSAQGWQSEAPTLDALETITASTILATEPPARQWLLEDWIPMRQTTALYAEGGSGKTLLAQQLMHAVVTGEPWLGLQTRQGAALGIFCEDEADELHRRLAAIVELSGGVVTNAEHLHMVPRVGLDNLLMTFDRDVGTRTPFWWQLRATVERIRPTLLVVDTAADTYGGNENVRPQVRQFVQQCLTSLAVEFDCAVVLCAHPSSAGVRAGTGEGGSTAWSNSVRARLYLERHESGAFSTLSRKKSNYSAAGESVEIAWHQGAFIPRVDADELAKSTEGLDPIEHAFMTLMRWCEEHEKPLSPAGNQGNYPPRFFTEIQRSVLGRTYTKGQYEVAFRALLKRGEVLEATRFNAQRNPRQAIVLREGND